MSEPNDKGAEGGQGGISAKIVVSGKEEIDRLNKQLEEVTTSKKTAEEKLKEFERINADIKKATEKLEAEKKALEEKNETLSTEKEDLQSKLELIAEKGFQKAKETFLGQAKDLIPDDMYKEMETIIDSPEKLEASKQTLKWLDSNLKAGKEAQDKLKKDAEEKFKTAKEAAGAPEELKTQEELDAWVKEHPKKDKNPALSSELGTGGSGKAPLSGEPSGQISTVKEYGSFGEMYADLLRRESSKDPRVAEEAKTIINKLWEKMITEIKANKAYIKPTEAEKPLTQMVKEGLKQDRGELS